MLPEVNFETEIVDVFYSNFMNKKPKDQQLTKPLKNALDMLKHRFMRLRLAQLVSNFCRKLEEEEVSEVTEHNPLLQDKRTADNVRVFHFKVVNFRLTSP